MYLFSVLILVVVVLLLFVLPLPLIMSDSSTLGRVKWVFHTSFTQSSNSAKKLKQPKDNL